MTPPPFFDKTEETVLQTIAILRFTYPDAAISCLYTVPLSERAYKVARVVCDVLHPNLASSFERDYAKLKLKNAANFLSAP